MRAAVLIAILGLSACEAPSGVALVSGSSPATTSARNSEPQSANSLPAGAQGLQSSGPNDTHPNYLSATFKAF